MPRNRRAPETGDFTVSLCVHFGEGVFRLDYSGIGENTALAKKALFYAIGKEREGDRKLGKEERERRREGKRVEEGREEGRKENENPALQALFTV